MCIFASLVKLGIKPNVNSHAFWQWAHEQQWLDNFSWGNLKLWLRNYTIQNNHGFVKDLTEESRIIAIHRIIHLSSFIPGGTMEANVRHIVLCATRR